MKRRIFVILIGLMIPLIFAAPAFAQGPDGRVVFGNNYTLEAEETLNGDLAVFLLHTKVLFLYSSRSPY